MTAGQSVSFASIRIISPGDECEVLEFPNLLTKTVCLLSGMARMAAHSFVSQLSPMIP